MAKLTSMMNIGGEMERKLKAFSDSLKQPQEQQEGRVRGNA